MAELSTVDRTAEVTHFAEHAEWTGIMSTDREQWLAVRRDYLTASDMAAVLGLDDRKSAFQVYADKITERKEKTEPDFATPMFWGTALEQPLAQIAAKHYGFGYEPGGALLRSRRHIKLAATLDGEALIGGAWGDYEGKTTSYFLRRDWNEEEQTPPTRVMVQVQHQLLVTQAPFAIIFCLIGGNRPVKIIVEPHAPLHAVMVEKGEWFMDLVARRVPPPITHLDQQAVEHLYPPAGDGVVRLPPEAVEWTRELREITAESKLLDQRDKALRNKLRQCIGSSTWGVLDEPVEDRRFWRWSTQSTPGYFVEARESRVLTAIKKGPYVPDVAALPLGAPVPEATLTENLEASLEAIKGASASVFSENLPKRKRKQARR